MVFTNTLFKKILNVKNTVVTDAVFSTDSDGVNHIRISVRPNKWHENDYPYYHRTCSQYDRQLDHPRSWRGLDWVGTLVDVVGYTHRIKCPEHGVVVTDVPWAYPGSGFTKEFDRTVGWPAEYLPQSAVSEYIRIDWKTIGRYIHSTLNEMEPERSRCLNNLVNIVIDGTHYKKGIHTLPSLSTMTQILLYWSNFTGISGRSSFPTLRQ